VVVSRYESPVQDIRFTGIP
jgi:hypothetical protein